jgi:hypothetical protein
MVTTFPVCAFPWSVGFFQTVDPSSYAATNKAEKNGDVKDRITDGPIFPSSHLSPEPAGNFMRLGMFFLSLLLFFNFYP